MLTSTDELCTMLCIGMEDYIRGFDVDLGIQVFHFHTWAMR